MTKTRNPNIAYIEKLILLLKKHNVTKFEQGDIKLELSVEFDFNKSMYSPETIDLASQEVSDSIRWAHTLED